jgi:fructose-1,6-bisphosphatase III
MTKDITAEHVLNDLRYLTLLARSFPTVADACTEIINLEAILNLPKGTEHFLSDIHGEYQAFNHVLKNASGAIKRKVNEIFSNTLRDFEKKELCTLIYYPEQKLELIRQYEKDLDDWYLITLNQLVRVCRNVSSKYTRSKVRKALPKEFSYIIQELLHESSDEPNKSAYVDQIISIDFHCECRQGQEVDAVAVFQSRQVAVAHAHADHVGDATRIAGSGSHPEDVMVTPLDIEVMVVAKCC